MLLFGERLKELRLKRNLTQDEAGSLFGIAPSTWGTYERGHREPTMENLTKIAKYFGVSIDYLCGLTDEIITIEEFKEDNPKELKEFLRQNEVLFNGAELSDEDKKRMVDILTGLFWENFTRNKWFLKKVWKKYHIFIFSCLSYYFL